MDVGVTTPIPPVAAVEPALEASAAAVQIVDHSAAAAAAVASAPVLPTPDATPRAEPNQRGAKRNAAPAAHRAAAAGPPPAPRKPRATAAAVPEPGRDPDVDLVAALMAHVSAAPAPAPAPAHPGGPARSASKPAAGAPVVTRAAVDQRVQRCKALHPDDREASRACRRRVCEGLWGRFPACPVRLMPRSATTA